VIRNTHRADAPDRTDGSLHSCSIGPELPSSAETYAVYFLAVSPAEILEPVKLFVGGFALVFKRVLNLVHQFVELTMSWKFVVGMAISVYTGRVFGSL
jgi:hypothetical protein